MQPAMVATAERNPRRALVLMTKSMLGPGVAETTNVIKIKSHQVLNAMNSPKFQSQGYQTVSPIAYLRVESVLPIFLKEFSMRSHSKSFVVASIALAAQFAIAQVAEQRSTLTDQREVAVTIYNDNLALVKDQRRVQLKAGAGALAFRDVSARMRPETAQLRSCAASAHRAH
jgi:hypothetical protein